MTGGSQRKSAIGVSGSCTTKTRHPPAGGDVRVKGRNEPPPAVLGHACTAKICRQKEHWHPVKRNALQGAERRHAEKVTKDQICKKVVPIDRLAKCHLSLEDCTWENHYHVPKKYRDSSTMSVGDEESVFIRTEPTSNIVVRTTEVENEDQDYSLAPEKSETLPDQYPHDENVSLFNPMNEPEEKDDSTIDSCEFESVAPSTVLSYKDAVSAPARPQRPRDLPPPLPPRPRPPAPANSDNGPYYELLAEKEELESRQTGINARVERLLLAYPPSAPPPDNRPVDLHNWKLDEQDRGYGLGLIYDEEESKDSEPPIYEPISRTLIRSPKTPITDDEDSVYSSVESVYTAIPPTAEEEVLVASVKRATVYICEPGHTLRKTHAKIDSIVDLVGVCNRGAEALETLWYWLTVSKKRAVTPLDAENDAFGRVREISSNVKKNRVFLAAMFGFKSVRTMRTGNIDYSRSMYTHSMEVQIYSQLAQTLIQKCSCSNVFTTAGDWYAHVLPRMWNELSVHNINYLTLGRARICMDTILYACNQISIKQSIGMSVNVTCPDKITPGKAKAGVAAGGIAIGPLQGPNHRTLDFRL
jgi:hypothetical protein